MRRQTTHVERTKLDLANERSDIVHSSVTNSHIDGFTQSLEPSSASSDGQPMKVQTNLANVDLQPPA